MSQVSKLKIYRNEKELSQSDLANMIKNVDGKKLTYHSISNWERFRRVPHPFEMNQVANILGVPVTEVFKEYFEGSYKQTKK